jgi:hypothetical protein
VIHVSAPHTPPPRPIRAAALACTLGWFALLLAPPLGARAAGAARQAAPVARPAQKPGAQPTKPDESLILNVAATAPWTDTGLMVRAGDRLDIRAWGTVRFGDAAAGRAVPPGGLGHGGDCSFVVTDSRVPAHALVANVAPQMTFDGLGFFVGPLWSGTVPVPGSTATEGRLFLGFNHGAMLCDRSGYDSWAFRINNSGAFTVEIAIRRRRPVG